MENSRVNEDLPAELLANAARVLTLTVDLRPDWIIVIEVMNGSDRVDGEITTIAKEKIRKLWKHNHEINRRLLEVLDELEGDLTSEIKSWRAT